jgi:hypothetical protein
MDLAQSKLNLHANLRFEILVRPHSHGRREPRLRRQLPAFYNIQSRQPTITYKFQPSKRISSSLVAFKKITISDEWDISYVNSEDKIKQGKELLAQGKVMMGLMNIVSALPLVVNSKQILQRRANWQMIF